MARKRKKGLFKHLNKIGFSNRLAVYILIFLLLGLIGGFYLGLKSIQYNYLGSLLCWTIVFTPIGTATSIAISKVVDKSKAENTAGGIKYDTVLNNIVNPDELEEIEDSNIDSPSI